MKNILRNFLLIWLSLASVNVMAAPTIINPDVTPNVVYECDLPATLGDVDNTLMPATDIAKINFEVSNDNQATWAPAGEVLATGDGIACLQSYTLSSSPDGTYFYRSVYTHVNGQVAPYTVALEVKLERPLLLLPMANPRITPAQ